MIFELFDYLANPKAFHILPVKLSSKNDFVLFSRIRHLMQDTDGRMSRSQLESALHYSGNYLNSIVKKYTGMSLFDYGMTFCLEKAATLLVTHGSAGFRHCGIPSFQQLGTLQPALRESLRHVPQGVPQAPQKASEKFPEKRSRGRAEKARKIILNFHGKVI